MNIVTILSILSIVLYLAASLLLFTQLTRKEINNDLFKKSALISAIFAGLLHLFTLRHELFTEAGINFGFENALSLLMFLMAAIIAVSALSKPVENLGIAVFPIAAFSVLLTLFLSSEHYVTQDADLRFEIHILSSIIAYSVLSIAAVHAILLYIQNEHLRNKHPGGFIRTLPPLQTMESMLFQMIGLGFVLQSVSLFTGLFFLEDIFAQHLVHKTTLSVLAWLLFATLLWGRWQFGWRGRTAIRWTLGGFFSLLFAYLGSKLVLEVMLS